MTMDTWDSIQSLVGLSWDCSTVIIGVFLVILSYFLFNRRGNSKQDRHVLRGEHSTSDKKSTACSSPDCVRCKTYKKSIATALERLYTYCKTNDSTDISNIVDTVGNTQVAEPGFRNALQQPNVFYLPTLKAKPFWDNVPKSLKTPVLSLDGYYDVIYNEFCDVYGKISDIDSGGWRSNTSEGGSWHIFHFYNQGVRNEENCQRCPQTAKIIEGMEGVMKGCIFGNVLFSVIYPGTLITEHYGPTNIRLRVHLGLDVPDGCALTVGGKTRAWQTGRCVIFDDSFLHQAEVRQDVTNLRAVLLVDFWHPGLKEPELEVLNYIFSPM